MEKIRIVRREGGSRVVSVSKVIPLDWIAVEVKVVKASSSLITVKIEKVR